MSIDRWDYIGNGLGFEKIDEGEQVKYEDIKELLEELQHLRYLQSLRNPTVEMWHVE